MLGMQLPRIVSGVPPADGPWLGDTEYTVGEHEELNAPELRLSFACSSRIVWRPLSSAWLL